MSTVYVVMEGAYSDYHLVGVYSTQEQAEVVEQALNSSDVHILAVPLDTDIAEYRAGRTLWEVMMAHDGTLLVEVRATTSRGDSDRDTTWPLWVNGEHKGYVDGREYYVWATDETHAIKVANERRARYLVERDLGVARG